MARYEFVKGLPVIMIAEGKQVGKVDDLVVAPERKMVNHNHNHNHDAIEPGDFGAGLLIGGLAGALAMLLLAPQSGKRTRAKLQRQSHELRAQTAETVEDAMAQARTKGRQIRAGAHKQAEALEQRGQDVIDEQKEHWSTLVKAGKAAI